MENDRLPTELWVEGQLRCLGADGVPYYIINKGAYDSGGVLLKINALEAGCLLYQFQRDLDGNLGWMRLFEGECVAESEADAYIRRAIDRDPDLWAVEIEDRKKRNPFEGKIF